MLWAEDDCEHGSRSICLSCFVGTRKYEGKIYIPQKEWNEQEPMAWHSTVSFRIRYDIELPTRATHQFIGRASQSVLTAIHNVTVLFSPPKHGASWKKWCVQQGFRVYTLDHLLYCYESVYMSIFRVARFVCPVRMIYVIYSGCEQFSLRMTPFRMNAMEIGKSWPP